MTTTVHGPGDPTPRFDGDFIASLDEDQTHVVEDDPRDDDALSEAEVVAIAAQMDAESEPLFDPKPYRTQTPVFDNLSSDKLTIAFGGAIELDATNPDDIATFERFTLGRPVRLVVVGYTAAKNATYKENADGEVTVTGKAGVRVHSLTLQAC